MKGIVTAEQCHVVHALPPQALDDTTVSDRFTMEKYGHASIGILIGVSSAAPDSIVLKECDQASGGTANAIAFNYYAETDAAGDVLGAKTAATSSGITSVTANDNVMYWIEIDAQDLTDGFPFLEVTIAGGSPTPTTTVAVVAILSGSRYAQESSPTALA